MSSAVCRTNRTKRRRQARDVRFSGLYAYLREERIRAIRGKAHDDPQAPAGGSFRQLKQELRRRMHDPVPQTGQWLKSVVQGYFNYYAVPGNLNSLSVSGIGRSCSVAFHSPTEPETPDPTGRVCCSWLSAGFLHRRRSIPFPTLASPLVIRDKNRMR